MAKSPVRTGLGPGPQLSEPEVFSYKRPEGEDPVAIVWGVKSDLVTTFVQIVREGGETHLHSHPKIDGFYFVLRGRARFHGEGDVVFADLGPDEGIIIPRGCKYWFESTSDAPLEMLQMSAFASGFEQQPVAISGRAGATSS